MKNLRLFAFSVLMILMVSGFADAARIGLRQIPRIFRQHSVAESSVTEKTQDPAEARKELETLCGQVKQDYRKISDETLAEAQKQLVRAVADLSRLLDKDPNREAAKSWRETFRTADLQKELQKEKPGTELLRQVWDALNSDVKGVRWTVFDGLRKALRRYQTVERLLNDKNYDAQIVNVCDNILKHVDKYAGNRDPLYAVAVYDVVIWLEDAAVIEPRTQKIADLLRATFSGVNVHVRAGKNFVSPGFVETAEETLEIDETINGTRMIGTGNIKRTSSAELGDSKKKAEIKVIVDADISSAATGSHPPVRLDSQMKGTMRGEKSIFLSADSFSAVPAKTRAHLNTTISNIRISGGPLIRAIAQSQIQSQREDSQAEARSRAEQRMSRRINEQVDPKIAELNEKYQSFVRQPLRNTGLFPRVWNLSSTPEYIAWDVLVAESAQPSAMNAAPTLPGSYDLSIQIHQSALNNAAATALGGRFFDEEKVTADLEKQFDSLPKFLKRDSSVEPVKLSFVAKAPIDVLFADGRIKAVIRLDDIKVANSNDKSYTITVEYKVKTEGNKIFLEQITAEAFPSNYDPKKGRLSTVQTMIRSYILRRLESLQKTIEGKPLELGGQWKDKGKLVPVFISAQDGWLTFGGNWE